MDTNLEVAPEAARGRDPCLLLPRTAHLPCQVPSLPPAFPWTSQGSGLLARSLHFYQGNDEPRVLPCKKGLQVLGLWPHLISSLHSPEASGLHHCTEAATKAQPEHLAT